MIDRYLRGAVSAEVAVMQLLQLTWSVDDAMAAIAAREDDSAAIAALRDLAIAHAAGCDAIAEILHADLDDHAPAPSPALGLARVRALFDHAVARSPEASVAMYSLGSPAVLARATAEVVAMLDAWGVLGRDRDALDLGCGIGRLLVPLAPRLRSIVGLDVSPGMIAACRARIAGLGNVRAELTDGRDLRALAAASLDLVYSVDAFPYLVRAGLAEAHLHDVARVLRPGGQLVIFHYDYGGAAPPAVPGLALQRRDPAPFQLWNADGYLLVRG